ncbi:MAG: family 16 glycosylhydrolase [Allomuricauda sp.]
MSSLNIAFISLILALSCSSGGSESADVPTDLVLNVTIVGSDASNPNGDGSGVVQASVSAKNAVRYAFRFENGDLQNSTSGSLEHIFTQDGTHSYTITAWAYSASGEFINKTVTVQVYKSDQAFATLVFSDEFEYEGSPDPEKWYHQVIPPNNGSWHNEELQHYTDRTDNSIVSDGTLKIVALKEQYTASGTTKSYTSARLNSKFAFTYGRVEFSAKLPGGAGTWPALWTMGANSNETGNYFGDQYGSVGWPDCGEIDIMEQNGWNKNSIITHFHWGDLNTGEYMNSGDTEPIEDASSAFHVYAMEWNSSSIKVFIDDALIYQLSNTSNKPYNDLHYLLMNLAMGGTLGGDVPENFSQDTLEVDYVRVYQ